MGFGPAEYWLLLAASGFVVGLLVGMTGVGAGSLTTPLLISGFGVPPAVAVGTDLLFASITKASAAWRHHRLGNVDWRILRTLAAGSVPAAVAVLAWLYLSKPDTVVVALGIRHGLAIALVVSAASIVIYPFVARPVGECSQVKVGHRTRMTVGLGIVLGALVALTSVGAGAIGVVVLAALFPVLAVRRLVGTDIVHAIPLTFVCGVGHAGLGNIDLTILAALLAGSVPGIAIGARATGLLSERLLRAVLAVVLLVAAYMVVPR